MHQFQELGWHLFSSDKRNEFALVLCFCISTKTLEKAFLGHQNAVERDGEDSGVAAIMSSNRLGRDVPRCLYEEQHDSTEVLGSIRYVAFT